jgi:hypothetical protein
MARENRTNNVITIDNNYSTVLPVEIWIKVILNLSIKDFLAISVTNKFFWNIFHDCNARKRYLLKFFNNDANDVLLFCYRQNLDSVLESLLRTMHNIDTPNLYSMGIAFTHIITMDTQDDCKTQERKLFIISTLLNEAKTLLNDSSSSSSTNNSHASNVDKFCFTVQDYALMALRWSIYYAEYSIVHYLLEDFGLKIMVNNVNCNRQWLLDILKKEKFDLVKLILKHNMKVNKDGLNTSLLEFSTVLSNNEKQKSYDLEILRLLASEGNIKSIEFLLEHTPEYANCERAFHEALFSIIISSALYNQITVLEYLISRYKISIAKIDSSFESLHIASKKGNVEIIILILKHHLSIIPLKIIENCLKNAIHYESQPIIEYLMNVPDVAFCLDSCLRASFAKGNREIISTILSKINFISTEHMKLACKTGDMKVIKLLFDCRDKQGISDFSLKWKIISMMYSIKKVIL